MTNPKPTSVSVLLFRSANQHSYSISSFLSSQERRNGNKKRSNNKERTRTRKMKQTEFPTRREQLQTTDNRTSAAYSELEQTTGVTHPDSREIIILIATRPVLKETTSARRQQTPLPVCNTAQHTCPLKNLKMVRNQINTKKRLFKQLIQK